MLNYYLKQQPHLFHDAVENQLERIKREKENELHAQVNNVPLLFPLILFCSHRDHVCHIMKEFSCNISSESG